MLDIIYEQIEGFLRVRLDQLELRKAILIRLDVVAVLHFVKPVCWMLMLVTALMILIGASGGHGARISAGVQVDWQQRIRGAETLDLPWLEAAGLSHAPKED